MTEKQIISLVEKTLKELLDQALKPVLRRQESIEKTLNLLYDHLEMIEDISKRVGVGNDEVKYLRERMDKNMKDLKADVQDIQGRVEETIEKKVDQVTQAVEDVRTNLEGGDKNA